MHKLARFPQYYASSSFRKSLAKWEIFRLHSMLILGKREQKILGSSAWSVPFPPKAKNFPPRGGGGNDDEEEENFIFMRARAERERRRRRLNNHASIFSKQIVVAREREETERGLERTSPSWHTLLLLGSSTVEYGYLHHTDLGIKISWTDSILAILLRIN